jgi:hypothetical protein
MTNVESYIHTDFSSHVCIEMESYIYRRLTNEVAANMEK